MVVSKELFFVGADIGVCHLGGGIPGKSYFGTGVSIGSILRGFLRVTRRDFAASLPSIGMKLAPSTVSQTFYRTGRTNGGIVIVSSGGSSMRWDQISSYVRYPLLPASHF